MRRILLIIGIIALGTVLVGGITTKPALLGRSITLEPSKHSVTGDYAPPRTPNEGVTTLLVLGISGGDNPAPLLTDTIMVAHLAPNDTPLLLSLPRDLVVRSDGTTGKINSIYQRHGGGATGRAAIAAIIRDITELTTQNSIVIDLSALARAIDSVGGINVYVRESFNDPAFPTPGFGTTTVLFQQGWRWMNGKTATQYIRTRATPHGDFDRIARQQDVLRALHQKIQGLHPLWDATTFFQLWNTIRGGIDTDLTLADIRSLLEWTGRVDIDAVNHVFLDPSRTPLMREINTPQEYAIIPAEGLGNYTAIRDYIQSLIADNETMKP